LNASDDNKYKSQGSWIDTSYISSKYIDFVFSPNVPSNIIIKNVTVVFEWTRNSIYVSAARIGVWDNSTGSYSTFNLNPPSVSADRTETFDVSSFINTQDDINNLKIRFQAMSDSCSNGGYTYNDLVKVIVSYDLPPCNNYTNSTICEADSRCDWCASCSGNQYSGGSDRCVDAGTCNHFCEFYPTPFCGATCEQNSDCPNYCNNNMLYHDGNCGSGCSCSYSSENCDSQDGWYNTTITQWVNATQCMEKQQLKQEYRDYSCNPSGCLYNVVNATWADTGNTRNKQNGTSCDDGLWCTNPDTCTAGVCGGPARDCNDVIGCTVDSCDEVNDQCVHSPNNTLCNDGNVCTDDSCSVLSDCIYNYNTNPCNDGYWCTVNDACSEGICSGTSRDCSESNIFGIATCANNPDNINYTWDFRNPFTSLCVEGNPGHCTTGNTTITHACNKTVCGAECDAQNPCSPNSCSQTYNDYCNGSKLVEYNNNKILDNTTVSDSCSNSCNLIACTCNNCQTNCSPPQTNSYCVKNVCGAECDKNGDCASKCVGKVRYYNGNCLDSCSCSYTTEDCNNDGWYNTTTTQWVDTTQCTEKQQVKQEYRSYGCSPSGCFYNVTSTQWLDTGNTRNKPDGTSCNDGYWCTINDVCTQGICSGTPNDTSTPQVQYVFSGNDWIGLGDTFYVDSKIIDDTASCMPPKCLIKITDNLGKTAYIDSHLQYDPEIQKCRGFVTVNDTFHESSAYLIIDVWDIGNHYNSSSTIVGIDNSKMIDISGVNASLWYRGGDWLNNVIATVNSTAFGSIKECSVDISGVSPENTLAPSGNTCTGNIRIPVDISDGPKKLTIKAVNINGKIVNDSVNIQIDNDPPAKAILSPTNDTSYSVQIPIVADITDSYSGTKNGTYRIVGDPWLFLGFIPIPWTAYDSGWVPLTFNGTTYNDNFNTTPLQSGKTYYLSAIVCDNAGNCIDPVVRFEVDKDSPTWPSGSTLTVTYSPYDKDGNVTLSWPAASDALGSINHYNIYVYNAAGYLLFAYSTTQTSYLLTNLPDGFYSFKVTAVDNAQPTGNENSGLTGSTMVDRTCSVDSTCTPSPSPQPSGGGGGGGGGGISVGAVGTKSMSITASDSIDVIAGSNSILTLKVTNTGSLGLTQVKITFTGVPAGWISITPSSVNIAAGSSQSYSVTISVPSTEKAESKTITFTATSAEGTTASKKTVVYVLTLVAPTAAKCGNSVCETGEDNTNCSVDCPAETPSGTTAGKPLGITGMFISVIKNPLYAILIALIIIAIVLIILCRKKFFGRIAKPAKRQPESF
jgi:hypothetical protein